MSQIFAVTSGKGGVGKSTVSAGLAFAFSGLSKKTLLVDMDEGLHAVYKVGESNNLFLVPAPSEVGKIDAFAFSGFVREAEKEYDIIIFDFPAGMDFSLYTCLPKGALFLTVAVPDPVSVRDAAAVSEKLSGLSCSSRLVINNFKYRLVKRGIFRNIDDIIDSAGLRLLGVVPSSEELAFLSVTHRIKPNGRPMRAFKRIAVRLCGESVLLPQPKKI